MAATHDLGFRLTHSPCSATGNERGPGHSFVAWPPLPNPPLDKRVDILYNTTQMVDQQRFLNSDSRCEGPFHGAFTAIFCHAAATPPPFECGAPFFRSCAPHFSQPGWDFLGPHKSVPSSSFPVTYPQICDLKNPRKSWDFRHPLFLEKPPTVRPRRPILPSAPERTIPTTRPSCHGSPAELLQKNGLTFGVARRIMKKTGLNEPRLNVSKVKGGKSHETGQPQQSGNLCLHLSRCNRTPHPPTLWGVGELLQPAPMNP